MYQCNIFLNDPTTENLKKTITVPTSFPMAFNVDGFSPGNHPLNTDAGRAGNVYGQLAIGIQQFLTMRAPLPAKWASTKTLMVQPHAGRMFNAFYDRRGLKFFFDQHPSEARMVYSASSPDIIQHELGHALLDAMRPDFWKYSAMFEVWAFHESFGDIWSMMMSLSHDEVIVALLEQTDGNLDKPNLVSGLAEEFGAAVWRRPLALREHTELHRYQDPATLPEKDRNIHSFSRIFTGAIYHLFVSLYKEFETEMGRVEAVKKSASIVWKMVVDAVPNVAIRPDFFDSFARCMLYIDFRDGHHYWRNLYGSFFRHNLLKEQNPALIALQSHEPDEVFQTGDRTMKIFHQRDDITVADGDLGIQSDNPLYHLQVDIALDVVEEDDQQHIAILKAPDVESARDSVRVSLDYLHRDDLVGDRDDQPFEIAGDRLIRKQFSCSCGG